MKKIKSLFVMAVLLLMVMVCVPVHGAADIAVQTTKKTGLVKVGSRYCYFDKNGNKRKNCWKSANGSKYYFNAKGYAATGGTKIGNYVYVFRPDGRLVRPSKKSLHNVGKYTFYVDRKGRATTGWFTIGSKLYRADAKGRITKNRTIEGIVLTKKGYAKTNTASRLKKADNEHCFQDYHEKHVKIGEAPGMLELCNKQREIQLRDNQSQVLQ